jgi:hypothetical protein
LRPSCEKRAIGGHGAEKEKNKFSKDLIKSLGEARDHAEGRAGGARVYVVECRRARQLPPTFIRCDSPREISEASKL